MALKVTIEGNELVIRLPANVKNPPSSASGKSLVVATTSGNQKSGFKVNGKEVIVGVNAYVKAG
jgi:hypothetical protein